MWPSPRRTRFNCRRDSARDCNVVVLDQDGVVEAEAVIETPAAPDCIFLERPHARVVLRVQTIRAFVATTASTSVRVTVATPDK